jgi:hypothetical protein
MTIDTKLSDKIICSNCGVHADFHNPNSPDDNFHNGVYCSKTKEQVINEYVEAQEKNKERFSKVLLQLQIALVAVEWYANKDNYTGGTPSYNIQRNVEIPYSDGNGSCTGTRTSGDDKGAVARRALDNINKIF